jgi:terminase large subunit-like protein
MSLRFHRRVKLLPGVHLYLKVMASLTNWLREFRKYHRDDKGSGKIVKRDDHLMDATRYLIVSGRLVMTTEPRYKPYTQRRSLGPDGWTCQPGGWHESAGCLPMSSAAIQFTRGAYQRTHVPS